MDSANGHFVIDDMSGLITLAKPLDREQRAMYNLTVRATDIGTPQLSTLANVLVIVLDINDNPPEFASKFYYSSVPENSNLGVEVVRVLATSKDSGINAEITYSIVGGNEHGMFDIHPETGKKFVFFDTHIISYGMNMRFQRKLYVTGMFCSRFRCSDC